MTGLVSKWADDKVLVDKAQQQDGDSKGHQKKSGDRLKSKWDSSITVSKSQPLASKWASAEEPNEPKYPKETKHDMNYRNSNTRDGIRSNSSPKKISHGSTHGSQERHKKNKDSREKKPERRSLTNEQRNNTRGAISVPLEKKQQLEGEDDSEDSQGEELPPMTDAGKSFATRLGLGVVSKSKPSSTIKQQDSKDSFETTDSEEEINEEVEEFDDEKLAPMTQAGMTLAQRLGMASLDDKPKITNNASRNRENDKIRNSNRGSLSSRSITSVPRGSYQTPRQKKLETFRKAKEEEEVKRKEEERQKEAKLKAEVESMFAKLNDSTRSWADIEDDE